MTKAKISDLDRKYLERTINFISTQRKGQKVETFNKEIGLYSFDMGWLQNKSCDVDGQTCKTAGCLLGTMQLMAKADGLDGKSVGHSIDHLLFYPEDDRNASKFKHKHYHNVTPKQAAKIAQHYLDTGKVNWSIR